jgi:hypothetical protein
MGVLRQYWKALGEASISIQPVGAMILVIAICRDSMVESTGTNPSGCALINCSDVTCAQAVQERFDSFDCNA